MKSKDFIKEGELPHQDLIGKYTATMRGGVRFPGTVVKIVGGINGMPFKAKAEFSNEPGSYFYKQIGGDGQLVEDSTNEARKQKPAKQNWFNTLQQSLASEDLEAAWDGMTMGGINYGETKRWTWDDGSRRGHFITIYRDDRGMYERPVHYAR